MSNIHRSLPDNEYQAAINSSSPSAGNPFVTSSDLSGAGGLKSAWIGFNGAVQTTSGTYTRQSAFVWPGTLVIPFLSKINVLLRRNGAATSASLRIYDVTNALVIAEVTGVTNLDETIFTNLGPINNLPIGEATFEIQMLRVGAGVGARAFCAGIELRG
jgi:hypothetical protein